MYGQVLLERIKELDLKQKDVAEYCNVSQSEISRIISNKRDAIDSNIFISLMKCLNLNPYCFGGFVRLNLGNPNDFINGNDLLNIISKKIREKHILQNELAFNIGISETYLSNILSGERKSLKIDDLAKLCDYLELNFQDYIVHKNIIPSYGKEFNKLKKIDGYYESDTTCPRDTYIFNKNVEENNLEEEKIKSYSSSKETVVKYGEIKRIGNDNITSMTIENISLGNAILLHEFLNKLPISNNKKVSCK